MADLLEITSGQERQVLRQYHEEEQARYNSSQKGTITEKKETRLNLFLRSLERIYCANLYLERRYGKYPIRNTR